MQTILHRAMLTLQQRLSMVCMTEKTRGNSSADVLFCPSPAMKYRSATYELGITSIHTFTHVTVACITLTPTTYIMPPIETHCNQVAQILS
eukprot:m.171210 g.171210  ORF g.171210 m.171210 type:complete len:91 (-) comp14549_c0_seq6:8285-8557(-)